MLKKAIYSNIGIWHNLNLKFLKNLLKLYLRSLATRLPRQYQRDDTKNSTIIIIPKFYINEY